MTGVRERGHRGEDADHELRGTGPDNQNSREPVPTNRNSQSAGPEGSLPMDDYHCLEQMAQFYRERIPERAVHAKGGDAYGSSLSRTR